MNETSAIDKLVKYGCEFCKREFLKESTTLRHICEPKRRWLDKDNHGNRIAFQCWLDFYKKNSAGRKNRTQEEFIRSAYYVAFVKFGNYCVDAKVINPSRYVDWLLKKNIGVDTWNTDSNYNKFLCEYMRIEDPFDALARTIEFSMELAEKENIQSHDILRYANVNRICYAITSGKISPWALFHSDSGIKFLEKIDPSQEKMIMDYIDPQQWAIKFAKESDIVVQVKDLLKQARW
jgi:hypothetical protein